MEQFFEQFSHCFHSKTRKSDKIALQYLKGLLLADKKNCTEMALVLDDKTNNQSLNHFLSDSVWDYKALEDSVGSFFYDLLDDEGMSNDCCLLIDECAIVKKGRKSAGVDRQYCGEVGKIENCQVGVFGAICSGSMVNLIKGSLATSKEDTKIDLAKEIIDYTKNHHKLPFSWVSFDAFYGRDMNMLFSLIKDSIAFTGDIPKTTMIYTEAFQMRIPKRVGTRGKHPTVRKPNKEAIRVDEYIKGLSKRDWKLMKIRNESRGGKLKAYFHKKTVYILDPGTQKRQKLTLLIRKEITKKNEPEIVRYTLCYDKEELTTGQWAYRTCKRYFIEKSFKEAKQELGMKDYQVRGEKGYLKHMAMVMLAQLFINTQKLYGIRKTEKLFSVASLVKIMKATDSSIEKVLENIRKAMDPKRVKTKAFYRKQLVLRI